MASKNRRIQSKRKAAAKEKTHKKSARAVLKEKSAGAQIKAAREAAAKEMQERAEKCGREVDVILRKYDCAIQAYPVLHQSQMGDGTATIGARSSIMARNTKEEAEEG